MRTVILPGVPSSKSDQTIETGGYRLKPLLAVWALAAAAIIVASTLSRPADDPKRPFRVTGSFTGYTNSGRTTNGIFRLVSSENAQVLIHSQVTRVDRSGDCQVASQAINTKLKPGASVDLLVPRPVEAGRWNVQFWLTEDPLSCRILRSLPAWLYYRVPSRWRDSGRWQPVEVTVEP